MLNIQRLIDAGFTDEDMDILATTFKMVGSKIARQVKAMNNIPFSDEMIDGALSRSDELMERIAKYQKSSTSLGGFDQWFT